MKIIFFVGELQNWSVNRKKASHEIKTLLYVLRFRVSGLFMKHVNWILTPLMMIFWLSLALWDPLMLIFSPVAFEIMIKMYNHEDACYLTAWTSLSPVPWDQSNIAKFTVITLSYYHYLITPNISIQIITCPLGLLSYYHYLINPNIGLSPVPWDQNEQHSQVHSPLQPQVLPITLKMSVTYISLSNK